MLTQDPLHRPSESATEGRNDLSRAALAVRYDEKGKFMFRTTAAAAAIVLGAGAAQAAVIDFEDFANGEAINTVSAGGVTATVTTVSGRKNAKFNQAVAFDTSLSGTADPDLEAPFTGPETGAPGSTNPGKVLIITQDGGPNDERFGGTVTFDFSQPINFLSFEAFDGGIFDVTSAKGDQALFAEEVLFSDNVSGFLAVDGFDGVSTLTFTFADSGEGASGAIDNLTFEVADTPAPIPLPAALPMMLAGLGGLGLVARRRRAA